MTKDGRRASSTNTRLRRGSRELRPTALFNAMLAAEYTPGTLGDSWLREILRAMDPFLNHGHGSIAWLFRRDRQFLPMAPAAINDGERFIEVATRISADLGEASLEVVLSPRRCLETASEAHKLGDAILKQPAFREHAHPFGIKDFLALKAMSPCGRMGCVIGAPLSAVAGTSSHDIRPWRLLSRCIGAGLSMQLSASSEAVDHSSTMAILSPDGRIEHLTPPQLQVAGCLAALRRAVVAREHARFSRADPMAAIKMLGASLMNYSLIDHFESDGKRFIIACALQSTPAALKGLSPRLRQVLELLLTSGKSRKELADELGVSLHTFDTEVKTLYRKWNVHSRAELAACARDHLAPGMR